MLRGRIAPSPTGFLHLGNAWAFLLAWLGVRVAGGELVLRIEDIDPQRSRSEFTEALIEDLRWLGLDWDEGPDVGGPYGPYAQSARLGEYAGAVKDFLARGLAYPCYCTRKELRGLGGAPQAGDEHETPYSGLCRGLSSLERAEKEAAGRRAAIRMRFPEELYARTMRFTDMALGPQTLSSGRYGADFAIQRSDGVFAYQLAASLDDIAMGITQVLRGADILQSTPRQLLFFALSGANPPEYGHIPLLCDHAGERLAKRHAALALRELRLSGVSPQSVVGFLAFHGGLADSLQPLSCRELLEHYAGFEDKKLIFRRLPPQMPLLPPDVARQLEKLR